MGTDLPIQRMHAPRAGFGELGAVEARYRALVEQIPAIVYLGELGPEGDWIYVGPQIERILGYTPEEWLAHPSPMETFVHPEDLPDFRRAEAAAHERGEGFVAEYRIRARDGRWVWIVDEGVVVHDAGGAPLFLQGLMHDMTERKESEELLRDAWRKEREAAEQLRTLDALKGTLLHTLSHDLKNPLTAIMTGAMTLARMHDQLSEEERLGLLEQMIARVRKMDRLLNDLLDLDRLDRGIVEPDRSPVDLCELVKQAVADAEIAGGRAVRVEARPVVVAVDGAQVERIVENLLANAMRHTPPGTEVVIRVDGVDGGALLSVEDRGPGVPREDRETVFEPFARGTAIPRAKGSGIGLSLVARFAELHGGRAWVEDRPGGGASFRVLLPGLPA